MNNKTLLIIFLVLLGIYGLTRFFSGEKEQNFDTELIQVDTASVTSIVIDPKSPEEPEITLKREEDRWIVSNGQLSVRATPSSVSSILNNVSLIRTKRIAAKNPEKWSEYEVEEGDGTRVRIYKDGELLEDFIVGRFSFNQQTRTGISYLRLSGENEVYAVDGMQTLTFGQGFNSYRNRSVLKMEPEMEVNQFAYKYPDTMLVFEKVAGQWTLNGQLVLDSAKVENYLNVLRNISGNDFADDFDDARVENYPQSTLTLSGIKLASSLQVNVFRDTTREKPFVIRSSQNPEAYFASDTTGIYQKLFKEVGDFLPEQ